MDRRGFLRLGAGGFAAAALGMPAKAESAPCQNLLHNLRDARTGQPFQNNDAFMLVYFGTANRIYEGCSADLLALQAGRDLALEQFEGARILPLLIYPEPAPGQSTNLVDAYVFSQDANFIGLTGEMKDAMGAALQYNAPYEIDRKTKQVKNHSRSIALIAPDGKMLAQYPTNTDQFTIANDAARKIKAYNGETCAAKPAPGTPLS